MARFYVPQPQIENGILRIEGGEVRHIRKVLRLKAGDEVTVFDGDAKEYHGTIVESQPSTIAVKVRDLSLSKKESSLGITLAQSLLKGEKMDLVVQKATELGISEIVPFYSSRSVPILERSKRAERHHRWERIAVEASKQCGRGVLPGIRPIQSYMEMLQSPMPDSLRLILWEKEGMGLKELFGEHTEKQKVFFVVGPEGGFSREEVEHAKTNTFIPIHLGNWILRSETASLSLLSILQYEWGDLGQ
jgi:16S rRNA (uracil1498-N3)-methyltransferase